MVKKGFRTKIGGCLTRRGTMFTTPHAALFDLRPVLNILRCELVQLFLLFARSNIPEKLQDCELQLFLSSIYVLLSNSEASCRISCSIISTE